jgi:hypothetical protein
MMDENPWLAADVVATQQVEYYPIMLIFVWLREP